jgi:hypothetical protein
MKKWQKWFIVPFAWLCFFGWIGGCALSVAYENNEPGIYLAISTIGFFISVILGGWDV